MNRSQYEKSKLELWRREYRDATQVELAADRVLSWLEDADITRTRDVIQIDTGGEAGLVILVMPEALEFRLPMIEWTQSYMGGSLSTRVWKRVNHGRLSDDRLRRLLEEAELEREAQSSKCRFCGEQFIPGRVLDCDGPVCHGCASDKLGVVF